jgi:hypothetical protein
MKLTFRPLFDEVAIDVARVKAWFGNNKISNT